MPRYRLPALARLASFGMLKFPSEKIFCASLGIPSVSAAQTTICGIKDMAGAEKPNTPAKTNIHKTSFLFIINYAPFHLPELTP